MPSVFIKHILQSYSAIILSLIQFNQSYYCGMDYLVHTL